MTRTMILVKILWPKVKTDYASRRASGLAACPRPSSHPAAMGGPSKKSSKRKQRRRLLRLYKGLPIADGEEGLQRQLRGRKARKEAAHYRRPQAT